MIGNGGVVCGFWSNPVVKIIGLVRRVDNTLSTGTTDKAKFEVFFNTGWFNSNSVGTA